MKSSAIIHSIHNIFKKYNLTLSVAESCTGGLICDYITSLSGASKFFKFGIVAYSNDAKIKVLGVSASTISKYGSICYQTAGQMAKKIRLLAKTDFSVATTGNLGPLTIEGKPKGLVFIAVSTNKKTFLKELTLKGNRKNNKQKTTIEGLKFLLEVMKSYKFYE